MEESTNQPKNFTRWPSGEDPTKYSIQKSSLSYQKKAKFNQTQSDRAVSATHISSLLSIKSQPQSLASSTPYSKSQVSTQLVYTVCHYLLTVNNKTSLLMTTCLVTLTLACHFSHHHLLQVSYGHVCLRKPGLNFIAATVW